MKKRCNRIIKNTIIAVFCAFTAFSHCAFALASNDDEYLTFDNTEIMQAFEYFYQYGLRAGNNYTYNDIYTTTGSISESANISLSSSGGSFSGSGTSAADIIGQWREGTHATTLSLNIPDDKIVAQLDPTSTTPSHLTLACTYNTPTDLAPAPSDYDYEYTKMTCTDSGFVDVSRYTVTLKPVDSGVYITGFTENSPVHLVSQDSPVYNPDYDSSMRILNASSFSGNLSLTENGSFSGTGTVSLNTTTTNTNTLKFVLPFMELSTLTNPSSNNPNTKYRYVLRKNDPFVIAFFAYRYINDPLGFGVRLSNDDSSETIASEIYKNAGKLSGSQFIGGLNFIAIETKIDLADSYYNKYYVNLFSNDYLNRSIIPLYVGHKSYMSNEIYRYIYGSDRLIDAINNQTNIIENGNSNSQQKGQQLNNQTTQMQNQMNQFQQIENTAGDNMNSALNNINTNPSLLSNNKFLVSADWIRQQFNRLVNNTPFEAVITFCLVFGLGLLLLGKVR